MTGMLHFHKMVRLVFIPHILTLVTISSLAACSTESESTGTLSQVPLVEPAQTALPESPETKVPPPLPNDPPSVDDEDPYAQKTFPADATLVHPMDKIDAAVQAGRFSAQQALVYKVWALHGDAELPAEFAGSLADQKRYFSNDSQSFLTEVVEKFSTLTLAQQQAVLPYLVPPAYRSRPGTTLNNKATLKTTAINTWSSRPGLLPPSVPGLDWVFIDAISSNMRIWYERDNPESRDVALLVKTYLGDESIPKLRTLMQKDPLSDTGATYSVVDESGKETVWGNGGDAKFDVYIHSSPERAYAWVQPYPLPPTSNAGCPARPTYMVVNSRYIWDTQQSRLKTVLAHEYFHALQMSFDRKSPCAEYDAIDEGTATWAKDFVYPTTNFEHDYWEFSEDGNMSLIGASYVSWPFFQFMVKKFGSDSMRTLHVNMGALNPYAAVDANFDGGFKKQWPEYVKTEWNRYPLDSDIFKTWDNYTASPGRGAKKADGHLPLIQTEFVQLDNRGSYMAKMPLNLPALTRAFFRFDLTMDPKIRSVSIENPVYFQQDHGAMRVLVKYVSSGQWKFEDWVDRMEDREICLDKKAEKIEEVIVMYSNYRHERGAPKVRGEPAFKATNMGCHQYQGNGTTLLKIRTPELTGDATVDFSLLYTESGRNDDQMFKGRFHLESATASYDYHGTTGEGCTGSSSGTLTFKTGVAVLGNTIGLYPYHVDYSNSRKYNFAANTDPSYVRVTHVCPAPKPPVTLAIQLGTLNSGIQGFQRVLDDGSLQGQTPEFSGFSYQWNLQPRAEP